MSGRELIVNGEPRRTSAANVAALMREMGYGEDVAGVAVALNDAVVPRATWAERVLEAGDRVEIVAAVQGG